MTYEQALASVVEEGTKDGKNAGSWFFDGNTADETYARVAKGIEDGDPEILDMLPRLDLSGQWADSATEDDILGACNVARADSEDEWVDETTYLASDDDWDALIDAYRDAYDDAAMAEVERSIAAHA